jgi:phage terminase large subunit GpA-like protein
MRQYHVPCPHCGEYQVLRWRHDNGSYGLRHNEATGAVYYGCVHCGERIDEHHKPDMLARGRWIPRHPERAVRGYHLSGLYSPLGLGFSWRELWAKWQDSHSDTANLKRFVNTTLGESWEEKGESLQDLALMARAEDYPDNLPILLRTAGVDVQKDRIELSVVGWGKGEEAWLMDHIILPGDTAEPHVWDDLDFALADARVDHAVIDSGYNTSFVYAFCESRSWCVAGKGITGMGRPLIEDANRRAQRLRTRRQKNGMPVEPLGVDQGKALVFARLSPKQAAAGGMFTGGPGYIHFSRSPAFDQEYYSQLAAEKLVTKFKGHRPFQEWIKTRPRNEALDCLVYAFASLYLTGVDLNAQSAPTPAAPLHTQPQSRRGVRYQFGA